MFIFAPSYICSLPAACSRYPDASVKVDSGDQSHLSKSEEVRERRNKETL